MITPAQVRKLALSFESSEEQPHFEKASFRVKKKIFATLDLKNKHAVLKLSEVDQSVFSDYDRAAVYPVHGAWGKQGWTIVVLSKVNKSIFIDALTTSYCNVAPKALSKKYRPE